MKHKHVHYTDIEEKEVHMDGVKDTTIRWMLTKDDGTPNFAMRMFTMGPGGHTPYHQHDWEHEVFIVEGTGFLVTEDGEEPMRAGDVIFMPANKMHQFRNGQEGKMRFLCLVPNSSY